MITEIEVKNFKTLRDVKIPLAPGITVMVGANNSGKSNALAVLKLLRGLERQPSAEAVAAMGGDASILSRDATDGLSISVRAALDGTAFGRLYVHSRGKQNPMFMKPLDFPASTEGSSLASRLDRQLGAFIAATSVHDLSVASLRESAIIQRESALEPDGRDVAAVLDNLAGDAPSLRDAIDETIRRAAHEVKRIVTRPGPTPGTKVLGVEEKDGRVYGADDMSDGLLLFIGLAVAAQLKTQTPCILAIEEPERGIHPRRLRDLLDQLLRLTKSGVQVVLTTHSPTLLDEFRDLPESVLIFDRDEKGTHVTRLSDRPDWAEQLKGAPLGELWYSGVLGGVPGR
ncbi:AAA family ATPase [Hyalangium versicolor]|uniref:AAA family ATPase n=1 Tax=Hyalangium versicolor TaxID=2861190 RepID=UPI001CCDFC5B|nr:AAA family ATPase [Hyalangium versicolor]